MVSKCKPPLKFNALWVASHTLLLSRHWSIAILFWRASSLQLELIFRTVFAQRVPLHPTVLSSFLVSTSQAAFHLLSIAARAERLWSPCSASGLKYFRRSTILMQLFASYDNWWKGQNMEERSSYSSLQAWDEFPHVEKHVSSNWMRKKAIDNASTQPRLSAVNPECKN